MTLLFYCIVDGGNDVASESGDGGGNRGGNEDGRRIFCKNVSDDATQEDFQDVLEPFGEVTDFYNPGKGFCFITFSTDEEAQACIAGLNGKEVNGQEVQMNIAKPKGEKGSGGGGGGRGSDEEGRKIFIHNVSEDATREDFEEEASKHGEITDFYNPKKGFAFITFSTKEEAEACIAAMNDTEVTGQTIQMNIAKPKRERVDPDDEVTRTYEDAEGNMKEVYVPAPDAPVDELFNMGISVGINFEKYKSIPVEVTGDDKVKPITTFEAAGLRPLLLENIKKCSYKTPTPIQKHGIPIILAGRDMMGCAQTGSGKTCAYMVPIIHSLIAQDADPGSGSRAAPQAVVLTPTRELANQVYSEARKFAAGSNIKCRVAFGGTSSSFQNSRLQQGCNILVSTTGRFIDFMDKGNINMENLQYLVLDEADRMLDDGFMPDVQKILENPNTPDKDKRQTLLFSATFSDDVQTAAQEFLKQNYLFLSVGLIGGVCSDVKQEFLKVDQFDKREKLEELLQAPDRNPTDRTLVFVQTKKNADFVTANLCQNGLEAVSIHGDRFLSQRFEALENFRSGLKPVLVATAVAARGLDIRGVELVINYDLPREVDEYVHRIGKLGLFHMI